MVPWRLLMLWLVPLAGCREFELTLLHTNDMHAWLDQGSSAGGICHSDRCYGGFPRVKYFTDSIKRTHRNVLYLNAGDNFQGTTYYTLFKWKVIEPFVDAMGFDAMSLGNHEFDDGLPGVVPYLTTVKTPWLCANLAAQREPSFQRVDIEPWKLFNVQGKTIAVIGYLTPETKDLAEIGNLSLTDEIESLRDASEAVRTRHGADIVIALGHSGWDRDIEIATNVPGIDLIVGGHSHTFHYTGPPPDKEVPVSVYPHMVVQKSGKVVPLVQAYAYTKYVGLLSLYFDDNNKLINATGNPVLMDETIPQDKELLRILNIWKGNSTALLQEEVGTIETDLMADGCRQRECNLGNLVTDALVDYGMSKCTKGKGWGWTDAPVAFNNAGDIRASISRGENNGKVTLGDLMTSLPFDEKVLKVSVNGSVFRQVLEHSVHHYDTTGRYQDGVFLQYSGVQVVYEMRREPGDRVVSAHVRCGRCIFPDYLPLTDDMDITFLTTGFTANGGDGYAMLTTATKQDLGDTKFLDVVKNYIKKESPVRKGIEGRIMIF